MKYFKVSMSDSIFVQILKQVDDLCDIENLDILI